ncbi:SAM-dependent O-methyltransferase [Gracilaria domingensis]|nr:SAM-dependent O-methyltransferase [Gracilaria domingensis]
MGTSFVPGRLLFGSRSLVRPRPSQLLARACAQHGAAAPKQTARERRRATVLARTNAHKELKRELDEQSGKLVGAIVTFPPFVRERCSLTPRLARVKVFLQKSDLNDVNLFRGRVRARLVHIFPELEERGLLRASDGFDVRVGGSIVVENIDSLKSGLEKCEKVGSPVFVEVIPHNTPPPREKFSERVEQVKKRAQIAEQNPNELLKMISFYKFVSVERPDAFCNMLRRAWSWMGVKGRVYVANEGVNGQLSVPNSILPDFQDAMNGLWIERGESIIPSELVGVFLNEDGLVKKEEQPFEKLQVKPREKVLADGFQEPLDWKRAGKPIHPEEWHRLMKSKGEDFVLLDCRNDYESDVGRFEGAETLNTPTFRDSWEELEKRLSNEDRSKKILTYCTGGIRCVKVNAFLEQKLGFSNTGRLQGGIVSYARNLRETGRLNESTFKGVNHVFDGRMGEIITSDMLDSCITCGQPCNIQTDCANVQCPRPFDSRIFVQCEECAVLMKGACSPECRGAVGITSNQSNQPTEGVRIPPISSDSELYAETFTISAVPELTSVRRRTEAEFPERVRMLSSDVQASLLRLLVQISGSKRVLEIGTFTGLATIAMASGLPSDGLVVTCECDEKAASIAEEFFTKTEECRDKIQLYRGQALDILERFHVKNWEPFDFAFVDADKGGYPAYAKKLLDYNLVRSGGILVFDNTLFHGEVAQIWKQETSSNVARQSHLHPQRLKNLSKAHRTAAKLHEFNKYIAEEDRLEQVLLPFRDGLTVARRSD